MAKDAKYYAKIGGSWEQQYFETQADQVKFSDLGGVLLNGVTDVETALSTINTKFNAANGFAGLNGSGQLRESQIPDSITGGMVFAGTVGSGTKKFSDIAGNGANQIEKKGEYLIATGAVLLTNSESTVTGTLQAPGDDGGDGTENNALPVSIEAGDWIVATTDLASNAISVAIINNTYRDASSARKGVVTLSSYTDGDGLSTLAGDGVMTEATTKLLLEDNFGTGSTNFARGNHNHDSDYYSITGGAIAGNVTIGNGDSAFDLIIDAEDDNNALGSRSNDIVFKHLPNGGSLTTVALDVSSDGNLQFGGYNVANSNNWNSTAVGIPEITVSTSAASGGKNGDVWIKYTA